MTTKTKTKPTHNRSADPGLSDYFYVWKYFKKLTNQAQLFRPL